MDTIARCKKLKIASLFAGIGGIDLGFAQAGFDIVWANEIDKSAAATYKYNLGANAIVVGNIKNINVRDIPDFDVLAAGFPCQSFSTAGSQRGFDDSRGNLFFQVVRVVEAKKPKVIFLENVENLIEHNDGKSFLTVYNALAPLGYSFKYKVLEPYEHGNVPQKRARVFIVGFSDDSVCSKFSFPAPISLTQTIETLFERSVKHSDCYYYDNSNQYFSKLKTLVTRKDCVYRIYDYGVSPKAYRICPTLTAYMETCNHERVPIILDDYGMRRLTPYECLKLQGFPSDFKFAPGTPMRNAYKQVGNSVCVPIIKRIAEQIKIAME